MVKINQIVMEKIQYEQEDKDREKLDLMAKINKLEMEARINQLKVERKDRDTLTFMEKINQIEMEKINQLEMG